MKIWLFLLFISIIAFKSTETSNACSWLKQDIVFILDASESISKNDFQLAKSFIIKMMTFIKHTNLDNRISFIVFASDANLVFDFVKYKDLNHMIHQVNLAKNSNGLTAIGKALKLTLENLVPQMRKDAQKFVVLFTDGTNNVFPSPYAYSDRLKDAFVRIITVGIGSEINREELTNIASPNLVITVNSFPNLMENMRKIIHHVCVIVDPIPNEPCHLKQQDLVILLDSSGSILHKDFDLAKGFIKNLIKKFEIGSQSTRVALIQFSNVVKNEFGFSLTNRDSILSRITHIKKLGGLTGLGLALREVQLKIKPHQRPRVPFNILILTDGFNNVFPQPNNIANQLKQHGANIICVGIGRNIKIHELKAISSNDKVLTVNSFDRLQNNMKTVLKAVTCG